ncbi:MAG: hypothetical protein ABIA76_05555 [Candidatus Diapherotrites archaeon]
MVLEIGLLFKTLAVLSVTLVGLFGTTAVIATISGEDSAAISFVFGPPEYYEFNGKRYPIPFGLINCGADIQCFKEAGAKGEHAIYFFGRESGEFAGLISQTIKDCGSGTCIVRIKFEEIPVNSPSALENLYSSAEIECEVPVSELGLPPENQNDCSVPMDVMFNVMKDAVTRMAFETVPEAN